MWLEGWYYSHIVYGKRSQDRLQQLPTNNTSLRPRVRPCPFGAYPTGRSWIKHVDHISQASPHGRSTIDAILALRLLSEFHREFNRPLNVAYLDIKAAFDPVDRRALWKALRSTDVPDILTDLIVALHENTGAQVRSGNN